MTDVPAIRIVGTIAYREHWTAIPNSFRASLLAEPDNRYNPKAIAVLFDGRKLGYVPPEVARHYYDAIADANASLTPASCAVQRVATPGEKRIKAYLSAAELAPFRRDG